MKTRVLMMAALALLLPLAGAATATITHWNTVDDFGNTSTDPVAQPEWTFGALGNDYTFWEATNAEWWYPAIASAHVLLLRDRLFPSPGYQDPGLIKNVTGADYDEGSYIRHKWGYLGQHMTGNMNRDIRWTAPSADEYVIKYHAAGDRLLGATNSGTAY
jgi:hypothetical protein